MQTSAFHSASLYPELNTLTCQFDQICAEAFSAYNNLTQVNDSRIHSTAWQVLPLCVEPEDDGVMSESLCQKNRLQAVQTCAIMQGLPAIKAYAFSLLQPDGHILPHSHDNAFVTAMLCLQDGGNAFIRVNGEVQYFRTGELIIFDYSQLHEVQNNGFKDRIVLLMLLENRLQTS
ncbi:MAG: aspartyl/asparaginyl beta-hydroxylase domain-containing protein [Pseudomonadales bacterium]|nr:aspartyl/asparaginyl beta-hydroxylase domain-containing protein [Pseudomonadales bacterium]